MKRPYCNNHIPDNSKQCEECGVIFTPEVPTVNETGFDLYSNVIAIILGVICIIVFWNSRHVYVINNIPFYFGIFMIITSVASIFRHITRKLNNNKVNLTLLVIYNVFTILSMLVFPCVFGYLAITQSDSTTRIFCLIMAIGSLIIPIYNIRYSIRVVKNDK